MAHPPPRTGRSVGTIIAVVVLSLLLVEATVRVFFALQVGPRILAYGTSWHRNEFADVPVNQKTVNTHENVVGDYEKYGSGRSTGYSKYFPNEVKATRGADEEAWYDVQINNQGFRGPDFEIEKAPETVRILTLGSSSTFGYRNNDEQTYPAQLQEVLDQTGGDTKYEVINFAIPHAVTDNIVAMLLAEGLALSPDVLTLYAGANDSAVVAEIDPGPIDAARLWLRQTSLAADFVLTAAGVVEGGGARNWGDEIARTRSAIYLENVEKLERLSRENGIRLIVTTQQVQSDMFPRGERRGVTYTDEVEKLRDSVASGQLGSGTRQGDLAGRVGAPEVAQVTEQLEPARIMLVHDVIMRDLKEWAATADVEFVDIRSALDDRRDLLVSWVHLHPDANRVVAEKLAEQIVTGAPAS